MSEKSRSKIVELVPGDLNCVDYHQAVSCIQRMTAEKFPVHLAVHSVDVGGVHSPEIYSEPHLHEELDEVNILISKTSLRYKITIEHEDHELAAPAAIWIPAGQNHSANVLSGEGFFICIRFDKK